jgi:hypothetical protein
VRSGLWLDTDLLFEHVDDFGFVSGQQRDNLGMSLMMVWYPPTPLGTLVQR